MNFLVLLYFVYTPKPDKIVKALSMLLEGVKSFYIGLLKKGSNVTFHFGSENLYGILLK